MITGLFIVLFFYYKIEKVKSRSSEILHQKAENKKNENFAPERSTISSILSKGSTLVWSLEKYITGPYSEGHIVSTLLWLSDYFTSLDRSDFRV